MLGKSGDASSFRGLLRSVAPVSISADCQEVLDRFNAEPHLQTLAVVSEEQDLVGVVVRSKLMTPALLASPMVPLADTAVTDIAETGSLVIDLKQRMAEVVDKVIYCDDHECLVDVPVVDEGVYLGLISLKEVLRHILERDRDDLFSLAYFDPLTGLPNRLLFQDRLEQACHSANRSPFCFALAFVDLDDFKEINDTYGHHFGDQVLQLVAERLKSSLRESDTVARLAGDEFVLIIGNLRDAPDVARICNTIQTKLAEAAPRDLDAISLSASIGVALCPLDDIAPQGLLLKADAAMYEAKSSVHRRYALYSEQGNVPLNMRQMLNRNIARAIEGNELLLFYQPILSLQTRQVVGVEALLRWQHPELGLLAPGKFLGAAEAANVMDEIGTWVLSTACRQHKQWTMRGLPGLRISVNLAPEQYRSSKFCFSVERVLNETGIEPNYLEFEVSEKVLKEETEQGLKNLTQLHRNGIAIGVDDFGLGFCNWEQLRRLPISNLKIDGSVIRNIDSSPSSAALLRTISRLGNHLQVKLVAEAVESEAEVDCLRSHQCQDAQGHVFGQPLPADQFEMWYQKNAAGKSDLAN